MTSFDAIATQTVRKAAHLEPGFVHKADIEAAARKLAARKKKPNILIYLMDDVGWGDFGCYGGGVANAAAVADDPVTLDAWNHFAAAVAETGRHLVFADDHTLQDGRLVASVAQEGMIRKVTPKS